MIYNSNDISEFDVARFKAVLDQITLTGFSAKEKLAFAEAMVLRAGELRKDAVRDNSVSSSEDGSARR